MIELSVDKNTPIRMIITVKDCYQAIITRDALGKYNRHLAAKTDKIQMLNSR